MSATSPSQRQRLRTELLRVVNTFCSPALSMRDLLEESMLIFSEEIILRRSSSSSSSKFLEPETPSPSVRVITPSHLLAARKDQAHFYISSIESSTCGTNDSNDVDVDVDGEVSVIGQTEDHDLASICSEPAQADFEFTDTLGSNLSITDLDNAFILDVPRVDNSNIVLEEEDGEVALEEADNHNMSSEVDDVVCHPNPTNTPVNLALVRDERDDVDFLLADTPLPDAAAPKKKRVRLSPEEALLKKQEELVLKQKALQEKMHAKMEADKEKARIAKEEKEAAALLKAQKKAEKAEKPKRQRKPKASASASDSPSTSIHSPGSAFSPATTGNKRKRPLNNDSKNNNNHNDIVAPNIAMELTANNPCDEDDDMFGLSKQHEDQDHYVPLSDADDLVSVSSEKQVAKDDDNDEVNASLSDIRDDVDVVRKRTINGNIYLVSMRSMVYDLNENEVGKIDPKTGNIIFFDASKSNNGSPVVSNNNADEEDEEEEEETY